MAFTFIHAADLHLDSPFEGLSADATEAPHVAETAREATFAALDNIVALCLKRHAEFLLIAGDIYDREYRTTRAQLRFRDAVQTLDRMIGYFPAEERDLARQQIALNLKAVIAQRLIVRTDGNGRVPALEILRNNSLAQKMLMTNKLKELYQVIKNQQDGMRTFDQSLLELVKTELITEEESMRYALNPAALKRMISGGYSDSDRGGIIGF